MKHFFRVLTLLLFVTTQVFSDNIAVKLSRSHVGMNESFSVEFILNSRIQEEPDFSALEKDFDVLSKSSGFQTTIVNGNFSEARSWNLVLMAKNEGELKIPSIRFGNQESLPQLIQVTKADAPKKEDALYLATEIRPHGSIYEQMPLIYIVKLYSSYPALHGALSELKTSDPDAIIKQFGPDSQYEVFDQTGKKRLVVERQYSIIPQHAGELIFYPIIFEGSTQSVPSFFNMQTNVKRVYSNQETVDVKQIPPSFQNDAWLPANFVSLKEEWSKDLNKIQTGEPLTWTVTITADGNFASQIPDIAFNFDKSIKAYPDKPELSNELTPTGFLGIKQIKMALIPQKPGTFIIPEIKLSWWDINEEVKKEVMIPSRSIDIAISDLEEESLVNNQTVASVDQKEHQEIVVADAQTILFHFKYIALLAVCIFFISCFFLYRKRGDNSLNMAKKAFKNACLNNQPKEAEHLFLYLMQKRYPGLKPLNLMSVKPFLSSDLQIALDSLYRTLYGEEKNWEGKLLFSAYSCFKPKKIKKESLKKSSILRELYPIDDSALNYTNYQK